MSIVDVLRRRKTSIVAALVALGAALTLSAWATASPPGSSPDEDFHLASIWCPKAIGGACVSRVVEDGERQVQVPYNVAWAASCTAFKPFESGACVEEFGTTPVFTARFDTGEYPGGFYTAMHIFVGRNLNASVYSMRLFNAAFAIGLLGAAVALLTGSNRRLVAYGGLVVATPMTVFMLASINPSGWSILGVTLAWIGLHGFYTEESTRRRWALGGMALVGAILAAVSRADAGAFIGVVSLAIVVLHLDRIRAKRAEEGMRGLAYWASLPVMTTLIGVLGFLAGGQNEALRGLEGGGNRTRELFFHNVLALPELLLSATIGPLNWLDTPVPPMTVIFVCMFSAGLVFWGLRSMNARKGIALGGLLFTIVSLPLLLLQLTGGEIGRYVQGRYLTPLLPAIVMTALWDPLKNTVPRLTRVQGSVIAIALTAANSAALWTQIRRFTSGLNVRWINLNAAVEWWVSPVSPMATWLLGSIGFGLLCLTYMWWSQGVTSSDSLEGTVSVTEGAK